MVPLPPGNTCELPKMAKNDKFGVSFFLFFTGAGHCAKLQQAVENHLQVDAEQVVKMAKSGQIKRNEIYQKCQKQPNISHTPPPTVANYLPRYPPYVVFFLRPPPPILCKDKHWLFTRPLPWSQTNICGRWARGRGGAPSHTYPPSVDHRALSPQGI